MVEKRKGDIVLFGAIDSREEALGIIDITSYAYLALSILNIIMIFWMKDDIVLYTAGAIVYGIVGFLLKYFKNNLMSVIGATLMLLQGVTVTINLINNNFKGSQGLVLLAILIYQGLRGIQATYKLRKFV